MLPFVAGLGCNPMHPGEGWRGRKRFWEQRKVLGTAEMGAEKF